MSFFETGLRFFGDSDLAVHDGSKGGNPRLGPLRTIKYSGDKLVAVNSCLCPYYISALQGHISGFPFRWDAGGVVDDADSKNSVSHG